MKLMSRLHMPAVRGNVHLGRRTIEKKKLVLVGGILFILTVAGGTLYMTVPSFKQQIDELLGRKADRTKAVRSAPAVRFELVPDEVRPNSYFQITGQFQDESGSPVTVEQGYFYVFRTDSLANPTGKELVLQGTLGINVSTFAQTVPTLSFADGEYEVDVSDQPLSTAEIGNLHSGYGIGGSGAYGLGQSNPASMPAVNSVPGLSGGAHY